MHRAFTAYRQVLHKLTTHASVSIDCSAELARYENVDDEMFLHYYDVDPVEVMQRAYEKTLSECKEEVRRFGFSPRTAGTGETRLRVGTRC